MKAPMQNVYYIGLNVHKGTGISWNRRNCFWARGRPGSRRRQDVAKRKGRNPGSGLMRQKIVAVARFELSDDVRPRGSPLQRLERRPQSAQIKSKAYRDSPRLLGAPES